MNSCRLEIIPPGSNNDTAGSKYVVGYLPWLGVSTWLADKLTLSNSIAVSSDGLSFVKDASVNDTSSNVDLVGIFQRSDASPLFANLAKSMTRNMRSKNWTDQSISVDEDYYMPNIIGAGTANGTATYNEVYVSIRWSWLAFPASLLLLTFVFLVLTILHTASSKTAVWKCSSLALLFHGLEEEGIKPFGTARNITKMDEMAEHNVVRLQETDRGLKLT